MFAIKACFDNGVKVSVICYFHDAPAAGGRSIEVQMFA